MGLFGGSGGGSQNTDPTGNPIPTGDTSGLGAGFTPNTTGVDTSGGISGFGPGSDLSDIASAVVNPSFGLQTAMGQSAFTNPNPPGIDPSQFGSGQTSGQASPVTSFQGHESAEQTPFKDNEAIQAIVNALRKDPNRGVPEAPSWFRPSDRPFPTGGGFGTEGAPQPQAQGFAPESQTHQRQTDPLSGSPHQGGFGITPEGQIFPPGGVPPTPGASRNQMLPPVPTPQPRPPEAPQFPMPQPRPPEAPQPEQYGPPSPDTPTPVRTVPAGPAPPGDVTRSTSPPATSAPPSAAPGQQRPQNPVQAIFQALGISPQMATKLAGVIRQVGQNYSGGPLPGRQIPASQSQTARREDQTTIPGMPEAPGTPGEAAKFIMDRGGHPGVLGSEKAPDINPEFADRVKKAAEAYEAETGKRAEFGEMGRSHELQADYRGRYLRHEGGLAAPAGYSRHEKGNAVDVPAGDFQNWMHRNASRFGINDLKGWQGRADRNHFQMDPNFAGGGGGGQPRQAQAQAQTGGMNRGAYERLFSGSHLSGQYENIVRAAQTNGVPPDLMASVIAEETGRGRSRQARILNNPAGVFRNGRYQQYGSIEEGIADAGKVIGNIYRRGGGTIRGMAQIYAPPNARNDPHHTNVQWPGAVSQFQRMLSEMQLSGQ